MFVTTHTQKASKFSTTPVPLCWQWTLSAQTSTCSPELSTTSCSLSFRVFYFFYLVSAFFLFIFSFMSASIFRTNIILELILFRVDHWFSSRSNNIYFSFLLYSFQEKINKRFNAHKGCDTKKKTSTKLHHGKPLFISIWANTKTRFPAEEEHCRLMSSTKTTCCPELKDKNCLIQRVYSINHWPYISFPYHLPPRHSSSRTFSLKFINEYKMGSLKKKELTNYRLLVFSNMSGRWLSFFLFWRVIIILFIVISFSKFNWHFDCPFLCPSWKLINLGYCSYWKLTAKDF